MPQGRKKGVRLRYSLEREEKIMELLADGFTSREIADRLCIAETHLSNLIYDMRKERAAKTTLQMVVNHFRKQEVA